MARKQASAGRALIAAWALAVAVVGCSSSGGGDDASLPEATPETKVLPGKSYVLRVGTHCGVERLGLPVNDVFWITDEADATATDWLPAQWAESVDDGLIPLTIMLSADQSTLKAEVAGHAAEYRRLAETDQDALCA